MKKNFLKNVFFACVSLLIFSAFFSACKNSENEVTPADTSQLTALIDSCQTLINSATTDDYPQDAITTFSNVVNAARSAVSSSTITQTAVDNLIVQLRQAREVFLASAYDAIPSSALILGLSFDENISNNQFTTEGKGWTAVLKKGPSEIFGTATNFPSVENNGKVGKAMYFSNGSHLEISDYTANDLLGSKLSISVWVNPDSTRAGNYIISYNYWNSWKFQLQEQNKPFFTIHTNADGWVDADNQADFSAPNKKWTHLVVTLDMNIKELIFYVNGVSTMEWNATTKPGLTGTGPWQYKNILPLIIGACTTYEEAIAEWNWSWAQTPQAWDNFVGLLDELKVYNIALTAGQVARLYEQEK
jgi:hypothetical protein